MGVTCIRDIFKGTTHFDINDEDRLKALAMFEMNAEVPSAVGVV